MAELQKFQRPFRVFLARLLAMYGPARLIYYAGLPADGWNGKSWRRRRFVIRRNVVVLGSVNGETDQPAVLEFSYISLLALPLEFEDHREPFHVMRTLKRDTVDCCTAERFACSGSGRCCSGSSAVS